MLPVAVVGRTHLRFHDFEKFGEDRDNIVCATMRLDSSF